MPLARGVIVDEDRVLLTVHRLDGDLHLFPGGEPRAGEATTEALTRHAVEQTGYETVTQELLWIRETLGGDAHLVEFFYKCSLSGAPMAAPHGGGPDQVGVEWVDCDRLPAVELRPRSLVEPVSQYLTDRSVTPPVYALESL